MKKNNNAKPLDFMDFRAVFANKKLPARGGTDFLLSHTLGTRRRWWDDMAATGMYDDRKCSPREPKGAQGEEISSNQRLGQKGVKNRHDNQSI